MSVRLLSEIAPRRWSGRADRFAGLYRHDGAIVHAHLEEIHADDLPLLNAPRARTLEHTFGLIVAGGAALIWLSAR